jgi:hypothetical protein
VIPWKKIFTSVPVYALILTHIGTNWGFLTILTLLPTYFTKVLHLDLKSVDILSVITIKIMFISNKNFILVLQNGLLSSIPYLTMAIVGWLASILSDKIRQREIVSVTVIRKVNNTIGNRVKRKYKKG